MFPQCQCLSYSHLGTGFNLQCPVTLTIYHQIMQRCLVTGLLLSYLRSANISFSPRTTNLRAQIIKMCNKSIKFYLISPSLRNNQNERKE